MRWKLSRNNKRDLFVAFVALLVWLTVLFLMSLLQVRSDTWYFFNQSSFQQAPLYDVIASNTQSFGISRSVPDVIVFAMLIITIIVLIVDRNKQVSSLVILRRVFIIATILYLIRAVTFSVTLLPPPISTCELRVAYNITDYLRLGFGQLAGLTTCTDLLYSGHTLIVALCALFLDYYSSVRILALLAYLTAIAQAFLVIASGMHYTVDIIFAFVLTIGVFTWYHLLLDHAYRNTLARHNPQVNGIGTNLDEENALNYYTSQENDSISNVQNQALNLQIDETTQMMPKRPIWSPFKNIIRFIDPAPLT